MVCGPTIPFGSRRISGPAFRMSSANAPAHASFERTDAGARGFGEAGLPGRNKSAELCSSVSFTPLAAIQVSPPPFRCSPWW